MVRLPPLFLLSSCFPFLFLSLLFSSFKTNSQYWRNSIFIFFVSFDFIFSLKTTFQKTGSGEDQRRVSNSFFFVSKKWFKKKPYLLLLMFYKNSIQSSPSSSPSSWASFPKSTARRLKSIFPPGNAKALYVETFFFKLSKTKTPSNPICNSPK